MIEIATNTCYTVSKRFGSQPSFLLLHNERQSRGKLVISLSGQKWTAEKEAQANFNKESVEFASILDKQ